MEAEEEDLDLGKSFNKYLCILVFMIHRRLFHAIVVVIHIRSNITLKNIKTLLFIIVNREKVNANSNFIRNHWLINMTF